MYSADAYCVPSAAGGSPAGAAPAGAVADTSVEAATSCAVAGGRPSSAGSQASAWAVTSKASGESRWNLMPPPQHAHEMAVRHASRRLTLLAPVDDPGRAAPSVSLVRSWG